VTSPRTDGGKCIYGFLVGFFAVVIRCLGSYPEGMMLAILLMNLFTPLINYCYKQSNIKRRLKRVANK
jgi:Na+-transporting NADH:ubiquinone oxidoreductase subunit B